MKRLLALLLVPSTAFAAAVAGADGLAWKWSPVESHRYYVETGVVLPTYMWFIAERNKEARVWTWQVRTVLDCDEAELQGRRSWEIRCEIEDIGIMAAALAGDRADDRKDPLLGPILEEMDAKLTGAEVQLVLRDDGRIVRVDLEGLDRSERRVGIMNENLRMLMMRVVAGFDLQLPDGGVATDGVWMQRESLLLVAPNQVGSMGGSETLHQVDREDGALAIVRTAGKGIVAPVPRGSDAPQNLFDTRVEAEAAFDTERGVLTERTWTVSGEATASSAVAEGTHGVPYFQQGMLKMLDPSFVADVGPTGEILPTTTQDLLIDMPMGYAPDLPQVPGDNPIRAEEVDPASPRLPGAEDSAPVVPVP